MPTGPPCLSDKQHSYLYKLVLTAGLRKHTSVIILIMLHCYACDRTLNANIVANFSMLNGDKNFLILALSTCDKFSCFELFICGFVVSGWKLIIMLQYLDKLTPLEKPITHHTC